MIILPRQARDKHSEDAKKIRLLAGSWGRYQSLPVRRDVTTLYTQTLNYTVQRFGGSMVNAAEYRWKRFRGPFYQRAPYAGVWYGGGAEFQSPGWRYVSISSESNLFRMGFQFQTEAWNIAQIAIAITSRNGLSHLN
jgi:hypothetical protein